MNEWHNLYVATTGAAAALTSLLFVGISINLTKILAYPSLPAKASVSIILLMAVLVISVLLLSPVENTTRMGWLISGVGTAVWATVTRADVRIYRLPPGLTDDNFRGTPCLTSCLSFHTLRTGYG